MEVKLINQKAKFNFKGGNPGFAVVSILGIAGYIFYTLTKRDINTKNLMIKKLQGDKIQNQIDFNCNDFCLDDFLLNNK